MKPCGHPGALQLIGTAAAAARAQFADLDEHYTSVN